jgi:myo-inositol-1(or 4)-monophosphatase
MSDGAKIAEIAEIAKILEVAREAAQKAGALLKERVGKIKSLDYKSAFNLVTDVDKASEDLVITTIRKAFPDDDFLGEEGGLKESAKSGAKRRWNIDPLDGTTNYAHSYPFFCVSIGVELGDEIICGVVFNPMADELFQATKGEGATLNGNKIHVSAQENLESSLLATGFPPDTLNSVFNNMESFRHITNMCHGVRRDGSAALDLCFVASGRLDGFWERKLSAWDVAAGSLIVSEAGGRVTSLEDGPLDMKSGHILATNGHIHQQVVNALDHAKSL